MRLFLVARRGRDKKEASSYDVAMESDLYRYAESGFYNVSEIVETRPIEIEIVVKTKDGGNG